MKFTRKIIKKFLSVLLAVILLFQPFFGAGVLAEGETTEQTEQTMAENTQTETDSSPQASAENNQTTTVSNDNAATVENNVEVIANTGDNSITQGLGVVEVPAQEPTPLASNQLTPSPTPELIEQNTSGDGVVAENENTGENSENIASASAEQITIITNENQVEEEFTATVSANTGENVASGSGAMVETGEATASAEVVNIVNTNLVGENFWQAIVNIFGTSENDIDLTQIEGSQNFDPVLISVLARNENTGDGSINIALANFLSSFAVYNTNTATLTNNIDLLALNGNNQIIGDEGEIQTGNARAWLNLFNLVNTNLTGRNWFFGIINIFGKLQGDIVLPYELELLGEDGEEGIQVSAINQNTGEGSQNQAQASAETRVEVTNTNEADLTNNISILANSGENEIVGSGSIQTGEANASANLVNIVNTNIFGSRWLFLLINNFGSWTGSLLGWWGNLIVTPGWTLAWVRLADDEGNQNVQVMAENENTGENSQNQTEAQATTSLVVENTNTARVENNLSIVADTGNNQIEGESVSLNTGEANASANIFNFINTNIIGNNWFFGIVNIFDWFWGNIIFPRPDLVISKSADRETVLPGEEITYIISYKNQGRLWAKETIITDTLPSGVTFVSASGGGVYQDGKVIWSLGKVWPGQQGSLTLVVMVPSDAAEGTQLTNTVSISTTTDEPHKNNNFSSVVTLVFITPLEPSPTPTSSPTPSPGEPGGVGGPPAGELGGPPGPPVCADTKPGTSTNLIVVAGPEGGQVTLSWTPPAPPYTYFLIAYSDDPSWPPKWGNPDVGNVNTFTVSGLGSGTYWFWLRAGNGCMPGDFTGPITPGAITGVAGAPAVAPGFLPGVLGEATPSGELGPALATEEGEVAGIETKPRNWWILILIGLAGIGGGFVFYFRFFRKK